MDLKDRFGFTDKQRDCGDTCPSGRRQLSIIAVLRKLVSRRPMILDQPADYWSGPLGALTSMDNTYFDFSGSATAISRWSNGVDVKNQMVE